MYEAKIFRLNEFFDMPIKDLMELKDYYSRYVENDRREWFKFTVGISKDDDLNECYFVWLWDYTGRTSVGEYAFSIQEYIPSATQSFIRADLNSYSKGIINCAECGEAIIPKTISAGTYCEKCWELPGVQSMRQNESED